MLWMADQGQRQQIPSGSDRRYHCNILQPPAPKSANFFRKCRHRIKFNHEKSFSSAGQRWLGDRAFGSQSYLFLRHRCPRRDTAEDATAAAPSSPVFPFLLLQIPEEMTTAIKDADLRAAARGPEDEEREQSITRKEQEVEASAAATFGGFVLAEALRR